MLCGTLILASLSLNLVQAIDPESLKCLHKFYVKEDRYMDLDWDNYGTYIGEVENLSATAMHEMKLTSIGKYDIRKHYQMYITGYCIAPNGTSLFKLKNLSTITSFDLDLQDRESVPANYLARLDPEGKAQKWMQLDMKGVEDVQEFGFNIWPAMQNWPHHVFFREKHIELTLFPGKIEKSRICENIVKEYPGFPENYLYLSELLGIAEPPVAKLDASVVFLRQNWTERRDKFNWELNIPYLGVSAWDKTREGYWVQNGTKGVFYTAPYQDYHYVSQFARYVPDRAVLGIIFN